MKRLHEVVLERRADILRNWAASLRGNMAPETTPLIELLDHMPAFLDEVTAALWRKTGTAESPSAAHHGVQRLRLGFDLDSVVREYGQLRTSIIDQAIREGVVVRHEEYDVLFDCIITGIADAVTQYSLQRTAELRRQANEHFAFIAHELRNPLFSAIVALQALQRTGALPATKQAESVAKSLDRLKDLIEQSLTLAFAGSGVELHRKRVALKDVVANAVYESSAEAEDKGIVLKIASPISVQLQIDERLVHSALTNLIRNAVKFTHPGGTVEVRYRLEGESVMLEVEDECGGLPRGRVEELFAPFVQAGIDRSGFGLGLAIARQAVAAHGGSIDVRNLPPKGCVFTIKLPIEATPSPGG